MSKQATKKPKKLMESNKESFVKSASTVEGITPQAIYSIAYSLQKVGFSAIFSGKAAKTMLTLTTTELGYLLEKNYNSFIRDWVSRSLRYLLTANMQATKKMQSSSFDSKKVGLKRSSGILQPSLESNARYPVNTGDSASVLLKIFDNQCHLNSLEKPLKHALRSSIELIANTFIVGSHTVAKSQEAIRTDRGKSLPNLNKIDELVVGNTTNNGSNGISHSLCEFQNERSKKNHKARLFDLPNEVLEIILFELSYKDMRSFLKSSQELKGRLFTSYVRLVPFHFILPRYESFDSFEQSSEIAAWVANGNELKQIDYPLIILFSSCKMPITGQNVLQNLLRRNHGYDGLITELGILFSNAKRASMWTQAAMFTSQCRLKILKLQICDMKLLLIFLRFLPATLKSLIIDINVDVLKFDLKTRKWLEETKFCCTKFDSKLQFLKIYKSIGKPIIDRNYNTMALTIARFFRMDSNQHELSILKSYERSLDSDIDWVTMKETSKEERPLTILACLSFVFADILKRCYKTLHVVDFCNIDAGIIFKYNRFLLYTRFENLLFFNICLESLPSATLWLPILASNNRQEVHYCHHSKPLQDQKKMTYTSTYIRKGVHLGSKIDKEYHMIWKLRKNGTNSDLLGNNDTEAKSLCFQEVESGSSVKAYDACGMLPLLLLKREPLVP